jgi:hypothetical protein
MDLKEAEAWLSGERSTINHHIENTENRGEALVNCAREDAAFTEQAYWVLRAHREGLVKSGT